MAARRIDFRFFDLAQAGQARGLVVVIDVVRAFTTAATAFSRGAERILLCGDVDEALALREQLPGSLVMGESGGQRVSGFDLWNSPREIAVLDLSGMTLIQRTSAGTQGAVAATGAIILLAASFVNCRATAQYIRDQQVNEVDVVITGSNASRGGFEDRACGDYLKALINKTGINPVKYINRAARLIPMLIEDGSQHAREISADVAECLAADRYPFAMRIQQNNGFLEMRPLYC